MRSVILALYAGFSLIAGGSLQATTVMRPEDYIKLTLASHRIILIDVQNVKFRTTQTTKGLEFREVTLVGKRVETIRGKDADTEFVDKSDEVRIVDQAEADRTQPSEVLEILEKAEAAPHRPSACKSGHRYLVIFLADMTIFFEVSKFDKKWRERVLELQEGY
jgi:hypothetical protein